MSKPPDLDLTREPFLVLDPGMHTAEVRRIDVDRAGRYLVTGSSDKTVRVWSIEDGRLVKTFHVPAGPGNLGKVYAVAISPDGETIAAGGWSRPNNNDIYLIDRSSGRLMLRIGGLLNVILHLAFSPDGSQLVATLGSNAGVCLFDSRTGALAAQDTPYGDGSHWASFAADGRIVTTSNSERMIRLYDAKLRLQKQTTLPANSFGVMFAPDGRRLAVGYHGTARVDVLDAKTLKSVFVPDVDGIERGDLATVAWSADGKLLLAAGSWNRNNQNLVRRWSEETQKVVGEHPLSSNRVMDLRPLPDGRMAFAAFDPTLGLFQTDGTMLWRREPPLADFRGQEEILATSERGDGVRFRYDVWDSPSQQWKFELTVFSLKQRALLPAATGDAFTTATISVPGFDVTNWRDGTDPKVNGKSVSLIAGDIVRSIAIIPEAHNFALGSDWGLSLCDRDGNRVWRQEIPGSAWAVTATGDGRLLIVAYGDGTIRWHRVTDGDELLAFYLHPDRERWVVWTPQGYYIASPGAEEFIGWQINRGWDELPEWYSASRFRDPFHRPDVIERVLEELDVASAVAKADAEAKRAELLPKAGTAIPAVRAARTVTRPALHALPPTIAVLDPHESAEIDTDELTVVFSVSAPDNDPPQRVKALVDGDLAAERTIPLQAPARRDLKIIVPLAPASSVLMLMASNGQGWSDPAIIRIRRPASVTPVELVKPTLYLLAVGVSIYKNHPQQNLKFAAQDAEDVLAVIRQQDRALYREVKALPLLDDDATQEEILNGLEWIEREMKQDDVAIVFFSGHGTNDARGDFYFQPHDVDAKDEIKLRRTSVDYVNIRRTLTSLSDRGKTLLFIDACHSGRALGKAGPPDVDRVVNELMAAENGVIVFSSSTGTQVSLEDAAWCNGAFTEALIEGLTGRADRDGDGYLHVSDLEIYVKERVKELTNGAQTPRFGAHEGRFTNPRILQVVSGDDPPAPGVQGGT